MTTTLQRLLAATRAAAERKHCGPDAEDLRRIAELEAEIAAPRLKAAADGAARSRGRLLSGATPTAQKLVARALLDLGDEATDAEVLARLKSRKLVPLAWRLSDVKRARTKLRRRADALQKP